MRRILLLSFLVGSLFLAKSTIASVETEVLTDNDQAVMFYDDDLITDLEAEKIPTTNKVAYWWENLKSDVAGLFIFNSKKKVSFYERKLHKLDRKISACTEIGDEKCISKIEKRVKKIERKTNKYIERRSKIKEQRSEQFKKWRAKRREHVKAFHLKAKKLKKNRHQLIKERKVNRRKAIQNRRKIKNKHMEYRVNKQEKELEEIEDNNKNIGKRKLPPKQDLTPQQRKHNREHMIEVRSNRLKGQLEQMQVKVDNHNSGLSKEVEAK